MVRYRVVITGLGVLAPNGCGRESFWQACLTGRSGVRGITRFDASALQTRIAGDVPDFSPSAYGLTPTECSSLDRGTQFALAAAHLALEDAGLDPSLLSAQELRQFGVYLGAAMATGERGERLWLELSQYGSYPPRGILPANELLPLMSSNVPSAAVLGHYQFAGPSLTISTGCSAGADAIGQAYWLIQQGRATRMLAGGTDSAISPLSLSIFNVMHALSTRNEEPARASRPYDVERDGFVLAEGAAVLVLEERERVLARGGHIYAEIVAFASNGNAHHMTALPPDGGPLQTLLHQVLAEARLSAEDLGYINSHGSSTRPNDVAETAAYKGVFGSQAARIPISSTKSLIGHTQGAASAIETLVTALALDQQVLPPTINLDEPDPLCDLDYIPEGARPLPATSPLRFALTHSSGFGGVNTALLLARHADAPALEHDPGKQSLAQGIPSLRALSPETPARRVVITGLGVVAPPGIGRDAFWSSLRAGRLAIAPLDTPDASLETSFFAGQVRQFRAEEYLDRKLLQRTDRMTHFALTALQEALSDSQLQLDQEDPRRVGAVIANTLGGINYVTQQIGNFYRRGPRAVSAYTAIAWLHVANVGQASVLHNLQGYCKTPVNDLVGGLDALGMAYQAIQRGAADIVLTGGCEAPLHPYALHVLDASLPFSPLASANAYRPFDRQATGLLIAEGAGICVLEEYEHALRRGASIYGEITGYAQSSAPRDLAHPLPPSSHAYMHTMRSVLQESCLAPDELACVYLDGRALPAWDASEAEALREVFGSDFSSLPCSVPRSQFGHSLAAAGVLDTICALLGLRDQTIAPTLNCREPDPLLCPPGLVRDVASSHAAHKRGVLLAGRAFGGSHVALALQTC